MIQKKDEKKVRFQFHARQTRQIIAIAIAFFLVLLSAVLYKRPLFGELPKGVLFGMQVITIAAFFAFTTLNWRCPSCRKSLGSDISKRVCGKCGARLQ
jgi:hypothetical protein